MILVFFIIYVMYICKLSRICLRYYLLYRVNEDYTWLYRDGSDNIAGNVDAIYNVHNEKRYFDALFDCYIFIFVKNRPVRFNNSYCSALSTF